MIGHAMEEGRSSRTALTDCGRRPAGRRRAGGSGHGWPPGDGERGELRGFAPQIVMEESGRRPRHRGRGRRRDARTAEAGPRLERCVAR